MDQYKSIFIDVTPEMIGLRLDKALSLHPEVATRTRAEYLLNHQLVRVNDQIKKNSYKVLGTEKIHLQIPIETHSSEELLPYDFPLDILFEDDNLLVVNKPTGLVVHPAAGHAQDTLVNALLHHTQKLSMKFAEKRPGIVHRIDKETSGLLVIAKKDLVHEALTEQFKKRTIHRIYYAVCVGIPIPKQGRIESTIARHPNHRKKMSSVDSSSDRGKKAITHYEVLNSTKEYSYLKLKLETGRTHQIRVHMSEKGCPLLGDQLYSSPRVWSRTKDLCPHRFLLHAAELGFVHPITQQNLLFKVSWPTTDSQLIQSLGLHHASL